MKRLTLFVTTALMAFLLLAACDGTAPPAAPANDNPASAAALPAKAKNSDGYVDISVAELAPVLEQNHNFTLVNVHIPYAGELPKTDLLIPFNEIMTNLDQLPAKDAPIVIYCRSGNMSAQAATELAAAGYTQVYELDGGTNAWQSAGYTLLDR